MLIWMRNSAYAGVIKFFLMGLLLLAVAGLVLTDVGGFFTGTMSQSSIVKGGGVNIGTQEFDNTLRRVLSQQGIGPQEAYQLGLVDKVLSSEIQTRLFSNQARGLGLEISNDMVMRQIAKLAEPLATNGQSKRDALLQILRNQGISEGEFVESIRYEMANTLLRAALQPPTNLPSPLMAKALYRYDNEKRDAQIVIFKNSDIKDVSKPNEEQLQKYYEANKIDFLIPETRKITIATLKPSMVSKKITVTDEQAMAEYKKNIAGYTKPSRRAVLQSVFDTEEKAKAALQSLKSDDKAKGFDKQELEQNGLLPEIAEPLFKANKGDVIGPIKTDLGWHVLKLTDILKETITPFEKVKDKIFEDLKHAGESESFYQAGTEIEDRAAGGDKLEDIVKDYGMTTETFGPILRNGKNSDGKDSLKSFGSDVQKIVESTFDTDMGEIAPVVETADGQLRLIRVDAVTPNKYRDLNVVKETLQKRWMDEQQKLANKARLTSAMEAVKSNKHLAEIAKENNLTVTNVSGIDRVSKPVAPLTPVIAAQIFNTEVGQNFSSETQDGFIIGSPTRMILPTMDEKISQDDIDALNDLTARALPNEILAQYIDKLSSSKNIQINKPLLQRLYGGNEDAQ